MNAIIETKKLTKSYVEARGYIELKRLKLNNSLRLV